MRFSAKKSEKNIENMFNTLVVSYLRQQLFSHQTAYQFVSVSARETKPARLAILPHFPYICQTIAQAYGIRTH